MKRLLQRIRVWLIFRVALWTYSHSIRKLLKTPPEDAALIITSLRWHFAHSEDRQTGDTMLEVINRLESKHKAIWSSKPQ